jgi:hypothetical protein
MRRDPTITLNPIFSVAIWFYHWFAWCPWIVPLYYAYKTVWWHGVVLAVAGLVLRFFISIVEGGLKLQRNAWAISLIGLCYTNFVGRFAGSLGALYGHDRSFRALQGLWSVGFSGLSSAAAYKLPVG